MCTKKYVTLYTIPRTSVNESQGAGVSRMFVLSKKETKKNNIQGMASAIPF